MKFLLLLFLGILSAATAFADEQPFFQVSARYEGLDPAFLADTTQSSKEPDVKLRQVVTRGRQPANLNLGDPLSLPSEVTSLPPGATKPAEMLLGITLEVEPVLSEGKIYLYGKSIVRRTASRDDAGPVQTHTDTTRESYFWGRATDDQPLTIKIGDGDKDSSRIVLTVKQIDEAEATRLTTPKFRVFAIEPTGEEAKKPVYQRYCIVPKDPPEPGENRALKTVRENGGFGLMIFVPPFRDVPYDAETDEEIAKSLHELSPDEQLFKVSGSLSARDSHNVNIKVASTAKSELQFTREVTLRWGSGILCALEDKTKPTGVRWFVVQQD